MKSRLIVHRFRPDVGGTELMTEGLAEGLVRLGHEVEVVTLRTGKAAARETVRAGPGAYTVRRLEYLGTRYRLPRRYLRTVREPADAIHVMGNRIWCTDLLLPFKRWVRSPIVLTAQNFYQLYMHPSRLNDLYFHHYFPWIAGGVAEYVVQTDQEGEQIRRFGYRGPMSKIPHAVDAGEFQREDGLAERFRSRHGLERARVVLTVGGFIPNKRVDRVVEGIARSAGGWTLVAIGRDEPGHAADLAHCRALAAHHHLPFLALGTDAPIPREEIVGAMKACDVYAQGSSYEGYGGAVQEGMAAGRPFIAYRTGAVPEFAAAGGGFCVDTPEEFGAALDRLREDTAQARRMGRAGVEEVRAHRSFEVVSQAYDRLLRGVAGQ